MWGRRELVSKQASTEALHVGCNHEPANREPSVHHAHDIALPPPSPSTSTLPLYRSGGSSWPVPLLLVGGTRAVSVPAPAGPAPAGRRRPGRRGRGSHHVPQAQARRLNTRSAHRRPERMPAVHTLRPRELLLRVVLDGCSQPHRLL